MQGIVKWYEPSKGYGFIKIDGGKDVFLHKSELKKSGINNLSEGDKLEFTTVKAPRGLQAQNIKRLG